MLCSVLIAGSLHRRLSHATAGLGRWAARRAEMCLVCLRALITSWHPADLAGCGLAGPSLRHGNFKRSYMPYMRPLRGCSFRHDGSAGSARPWCASSPEASAPCHIVQIAIQGIVGPLDQISSGWISATFKAHEMPCMSKLTRSAHQQISVRLQLTI